MDNKKQLNNTFVKGMNWDSHVSVSDNQSMRYALNIINSDDKQDTYKSNEHSNTKIFSHSIPIVGRKYINSINSTIVFLQSGEIYIDNHDTKESKFVASDTEFGCDWGFKECEWIDIHNYYEYICDTWITYSSNKIFYNLNLSELLDPKRKEGLKQAMNACGSGCAIRTCEYFKVFKKSCDPHIEAVALEGGTLRNGTYFVGGRYRNSQGAYSNPFIMTSAIHIGGNNNIAGEISNKRLEISIQNASCIYDQIEFFIHEIVNNNQITRALPATNISGRNYSISYTGNDTGIVIDSAELYVNGRTYIEGEDLYLHNNRALYYRTTPEFEYNFQPVANQIEVEWYAVKVPMVDVKKYNLKSLYRNETYAVSFSPNYADGRKGFGFHIPAIPVGCGTSLGGLNTGLQGLIGNPNGSDGSSIADDDTTGTIGQPGTIDISFNTGVLYKRIRASLPSSVNNLHEDEYVDFGENVVNQWVTNIDDICKAIEAGCGSIFGNALNEDGSVNCDCGDAIDAMCEAERRKKQAELCRQDSAKAEEIGATWFSAISNYIDETKKTGVKPGWTKSDNTIVGMSPANIITNPVQSVAKFKQAALDIINSVKKRERTYYDYKPHKFNKSVSYETDTLPNNNTGIQSLILGGDNGPNNETNFEVSDGIYKTYPIVKRGKTIPKIEKNTKYPCIVDCNGRHIYCGNAGSNVSHHTMPSNAEVPFWVPKSTGDGSTYQNDSDIMDGYAILLGLRFINIDIPLEVKDKLCLSNPYNIGIVKRNVHNSSIILKGAATETYVSQNQGKDYLYYKYGVNSMEKISKYIDIDGVRMGGTDNTSNVMMYSLDQLVRKPYLNGTHYIIEGSMRGTGARHLLYSRGLEPHDNRANREDQSGSVHTITMGEFSGANSKGELQGQIYSGANQVTSPPVGGSIPLMNKSGQSCAWLIGNGIGRGLNEDSFVGDVLQDQAPIQEAEMDYFSVFRELDDQYGDLPSLNYVPVIQARGFQNIVQGLIGDVYIGPYSFVKTGYVSDRVGNYFPISTYPGLEGKADRCICDDPEDAINALAGKWYWKALPKDGDAADAKRWAGTHTKPTTKTWEQSRMTPTESHYYYPRTTKHLITYVGESEANPWLREKSNLLENQWYPEIKPIYTLHSKDNVGKDWKIGYLNQFYKLIEQPSQLRLALKVLIQSFINIALPILGINDWTNPESGIEFAGDMVGAVMQFAVWLMVSQALFTEDFVGSFLGLEACKKDEDNHEDNNIEAWFENYGNYNEDYSIDYFHPTIVGLPMSYTGCTCQDDVTNKIYISDENDISYYYNGYQIIRPRSYILLDESRGKLTKIYSFGNNLFLHTTDGIYSSKIGSIQIPTNIGDLLMGSNNMISIPQLITNDSPEGQYGLDHPNHGKLTSLGFVFVDYNGKDIIIFDGNKFDVLSSEKYEMNKFFKSHLNFCTDSDCKFEQVEGTNYYAFGVDHKHRRLMFTKGDGEHSYTMSFDYTKGQWVSFHSYIPQEYINDRNDLYTLYENNIWVHNDYDKFTTYYDDFYGCKLDFTTVYNPESSQAYRKNFDYASTEIYTEAVQDNLRARKITFNEMAIVNSWQSTGYIGLKVATNVDELSSDKQQRLKDKVQFIDAFKTHNTFRVNELRDYTNDYNSEVLHYDPCKVEPEILNGSNYVNISDQTYTKKIVSDDYLYYRFIFNTFASVKLYIKNIVTNITLKQF